MIRLPHPIRALRRRALTRRKASEATGIILMYHRIGPPGVDPWQLAVTPNHFAEHLDVMRRLARPMPLRKMARNARTGRMVDASLAVTFDDGFADNLHAAYPLLERAGVPATVYVTTGPTGTAREFWWDELDRLILAPAQLPSELTLPIGERTRRWRLGRAVTGAWHDGAGAHPARRRFHYGVWAALQPLSHAARERALEALRAWSAGAPPPRATHRVMTAEEIVRLAAGGLVDIGAHTVTHPHLPSLPEMAQRDEIEQSRATLQRLLDRPITSFSYPYGAASAVTVALARDAGFENATTVQEQTVWQGDDPYRLPRFAVRNWDGAEFERRLMKWRTQHASVDS